MLTATRIQSDDIASHDPCRALIWARRTSTDGLFLLVMNRHLWAGAQDSTGRPCPRSRPPGGAGRRPEASGWHRLATAVCGEYVRKLLRARRLRWSQPCNQWTVNPSRKLRRVESTCHAGWGSYRRPRRWRPGVFMAGMRLLSPESHGDHTAHQQRSVPFSVCAGEGHNSIGPGLSALTSER